MSLHGQMHKGFAEVLTLPEVTFNAEWIDPLPWPWLSDSICIKEL